MSCCEAFSLVLLQSIRMQYTVYMKPTVNPVKTLVTWQKQVAMHKHVLTGHSHDKLDTSQPFGLNEVR